MIAVLHAQFMHIFEFTRDGLNRFAVDAESLRPLKRLSGELQQDPSICRLAFFTALFPAFFVAAMRLRSRDLKSREL